MSRFSIVYYICGHGYGHAVRSIEILKALRALSPGIALNIRTNAPRWLFSSLEPPVTFSAVQFESGVVQKNSFSVDVKATLESAGNLLERLDELLDAEVTALRRCPVDLIVSDINPFAFEVAQRIGVSGIAVGNFSWDWIFAGWVQRYPHYRFLIERFRFAYRKAALLLRLPFHGDMEVFSRIEDIPLVGRRSARSPHPIRRALDPGVSGRRLVFLPLRDDDLSRIQWQRVGRIENIQFLTLSQRFKAPNLIRYSDETVPFEDLLAASDAVICKPGYGIVSECLLNRTPIVYVPRRDFIEDGVLRAALRRHAVSRALPVADFNRGEWQRTLDLLWSEKKPWPEFHNDGARAAAQVLLGHCE